MKTVYDQVMDEIKDLENERELEKLEWKKQKRKAFEGFKEVLHNVRSKDHSLGFLFKVTIKED